MKNPPKTPIESDGTAWRPVGDWPYDVSDRGQVRRHRGRELRQTPDGSGYPQVSLMRGGHKKNRHVHRLVAEAFLGPSNLHVDHINGDKLDNRLSNLEYVTISENVRRAQAMGLRKPPPVLRGQTNPGATLSDWAVSEIRRRAASGVSQTRLAREYGCHRTTISRIVSRTRR